MRKACLALWLLAAAAIVLAAQAPRKFSEPDSVSEIVDLERGQSFLNDRDLAHVFNQAAYLNIAFTRGRDEATIEALQEKVAAVEGLRADYESLAAKYSELADIQKKAFDELLAEQQRTVGLVNDSIKNTANALAYARKVRAISIAASGLVGCLGGGFIDGSKGSFGLAGAGIGTAAGALLAFGAQWLFGR